MTVELLAAAACTLLGFGIVEAARHRRRIHSVPVRIHVGGTRGKSSVTRLVAGGLRRAGKRTVAKTTGSLPSFIFPDGRETPILRAGAPNVIEQARIFASARELGADAIVLECMALQPELHWLCESKLIRATHAVITNVRADHLDVMGPTEADVARCLAAMIPIGGVLVTAEETHLAVLEEACLDRNTKLVRVTQDEVLAISDHELARFEHIEHRENVAVALRVLAELGVDRDLAFEGMWAAPPDPGALTEHDLAFFGRRIVFVNAFAANDPDSTSRVYHLARARYPELEHVIALFNLREDRPDRTRQLARDTACWHSADHVVLVGDGARLFAREAGRVNIAKERFTIVDHEAVDAMFESIVELCGRETLVIGMGNIGGPGFELVRMFKNRRTLMPDPTRVKGELL